MSLHNNNPEEIKKHNRGDPNSHREDPHREDLHQISLSKRTESEYNSDFSIITWIKHFFGGSEKEEATNRHLENKEVVEGKNAENTVNDEVREKDLSEKDIAKESKEHGNGSECILPAYWYNLQSPTDQTAEKKEIPLTIEELEKMKAAAEGDTAENSGFGAPIYTLYGSSSIVQSVPRDLGIGPITFGFIPIIFPVIPPKVESVKPDNEVLITDLTPKLLGGDAVVDEDDLLSSRGPNESEGSDPAKESTTVGGDFRISAPDGVAILSVGGLILIQNDVFTPNTITTPLGNTLSFTSYDPSTGIVTYLYTLNDNEQHPPGDGENSLFEDFPVFLQDTDGDMANDILSIRVIDDIPSILTSERNESLVVDETNLSQNATGSFAGLFSAIPGADGAQGIQYALNVVQGSNSGLIDTFTNQPVLLFLESGNVVGRIDGPAGAIVFTISIDLNTGFVTLDQSRAVVHDDPTDPDEATSPAMLADPSLISLSATITDNDGDIATAFKNIGDAFQFRDDGPSIQVSLADTAPDQLLVDETNLAINASANFADNFTTSSNFGADGAGTLTGTFALSILANGADSGLDDVATGQNVLLFLNGGVVEGRTQISNDLVFTVSVDAGGTVTLDQIRALVHPNPNDPDDSVTLSNANLVQLTFTGTIVDKDGDSAISSAILNIGQALVFKDDGPSIQVAVVAAPDQLLVDETNLAINASANFADNFSTTSNFGADGAGTVSGTFALSVLANGADSGLDDVATGQNVLLFLNAGVVEGRTQISNDLVFTVSVDAGGTVTLDQIRALVHPNPNDPDDSVTLSNANLVQLTFTGTIVDRDGDSAVGSAKLNIGQALVFKDDGPSILVNVIAAADQLLVDETNLAINASANFADNFNTTSNFGADGAGTLTGVFTLSISANGVDSGLDDVATGQNVLLFMNGGVVEGRTQVSNALVFTVSVDAAGIVTLDQIRALVHPNTSNPDDSVTLSSANLIQLTFTGTIVDRDGDSAVSAATLNIGQALVFKDDGPSIQVSLADTAADQLLVDETNLAINASANFADNFTTTSNFGADGAGTLTGTFALSVLANGADSGLDDVATGQNVLLFLNGGVVEGRTQISNDLVFTVSVDPAGIVTLDQIRALVHPNPNDPDDSVTLISNNLIKLTFTGTIVDRDGDSAVSSATLNIGQSFTFKDDGPSTQVTIVAPPDQLLVDETNLLQNASANFADNFAINSSIFGADGPGTLTGTFALSISANGADSGLDDVATGQNVLLFMNAGVVEGRTQISNDLVFTVSVDAGGTVTLDQIRALVHPNPNDPDDSVTLSNANLIQLTFTGTIVDRDGDSAASSVTLNIGQALVFKDDGPSILVNVIAAADQLLVDETNLAINASANFADNFAITNSNFGADGAGTLSSTFALSISANGADSGLDDVATGQNVLLFMNAGVVEGRTQISNALVFTVSVDAAGIVTLDQIRALVHPNTSNPDDSVTLSSANLIQLTFTGTIVDRDGDTAVSAATLNIGQALVFKDDGPSILVNVIASPDQLLVDETNLAINASANYADNFNTTSSFGADGAGTLTGTFALSISASGADSGLDDVATGQNVLLFMNGGVVEGRTQISNALVFTVSVDAAGTVTLDQIRALVHPNTSNPDDSVTLISPDLVQLTFTGTIVDRDGDSAVSSAKLNIGQALVFKDDGPSILVNVIAAPDQLLVDETNLAINASANFADNFNTTSSFGADGAGTLTGVFALSISANGVDSGLDDVATGQNVLLFMNGGVVEGRTQVSNALVFTVSVDAAGIVTLDQIRALVHPNTSDPDDSVTLSSANLVQLTLTSTIVDRDGDSAVSAATLNIGQALVFKDDGPSILVNVIASPDQLLVDETNLAINASANFADNFNTTSSFGADGAGTLTGVFTLSISANGVDSGLDDVATGQNVLLFMNGGVVEGRTQVSNALVFTVSVDAAGIVTLDQIRALVHPNTSDPDDSVTLSSANLVQLTLTSTIVDRDGDSAVSAATLNIGQALVFKDDGPSILVNVIASPDQLLVDETNLAINASANYADNFNTTSSFGADGAGTLTGTFALSISASGADSGLDDVATGQNVLLFMNGGVVEGRTQISNALVFTVSVDAAGTVTLDQIRALVHPNTSNPDDSVTLISPDLVQLTLTGTIVDRDGDSAVSSAKLNIGQALVFKDDGPSVLVNVIAAADQLLVDETNLAINASANYADNFNTTSSFGADGAGTLTGVFALSISANGVDSGLDDVATGQNVLLFMNAGVVEGRTQISNDLVFTVSVSAGGTVTLDQIRALVHPNTSNPDDSVTLSAANLVQLTFTQTIVDRDGDSAVSAATINIGQALVFKDDGPSVLVNTIAAADPLLVDETNLALNASANFADNFNVTSSFGADGAGTLTGVFTLSISANGVDSGLDDVATGQNVLLFMNGGVVEGRTQVSNALVFTVSVSGAGVVTLDQIRALVHPNTSNPDDSVTLSAANLILLTLTETIVDRDGDSAISAASINIGQALTFKDDGPSFTNVNNPDADSTVEISALNPAANGSTNIGLIDWLYGADGGPAPTLQSISGSGTVSIGSSSPSQIVINFFDASAVLVATLTLNANGTDSLNLIHRSNLVFTDTLLTSDVTAGGPELTKYIISSISDLRVKITGSDGDATPNEADDQVNPSTQGWAISNNLVNRFESIKFEFIDESDFPVITPKPIQNFNFAADGFTGGETQFDIQVTVTYAGGATEIFLLSVTDGQNVSVKDLPGFNTGTLIQAVDVKHVDITSGTNDGFRLNNVSITSESQEPPPDLNYNFTLNLTDGDGDSVTQAFSLHLDGDAGASITVDGPLAGATIFQDINYNVAVDINEHSTLSDSIGAYNLIIADANLDGTIDTHDGRLVSMGGYDIETNLTYEIPLFAPIGSAIISPLTSLLEMQIEARKESPQVVMDSLVKALGLASGTDLTKLNPTLTSEGGTYHALAIAAAIMTLSIQLSEATENILHVSQAESIDEIYLAIGNQIMKLPEGTQPDLSDPALMQAIINDLSGQLQIDSSLYHPIFNIMIASQDALQSAISNLPVGSDPVDAISEVQNITQGSIAHAIGAYYQGDLSLESLNSLQASLPHESTTPMTAEPSTEAAAPITADPSTETSAPTPAVSNGEEKPQVVEGNILQDTVKDNTQTETIVSFKYHNEANEVVEANSGQSVITHSGGILTISANGDFTYIPKEADKPFNEMIEYRTIDQHGKQESAMMSIHTADADLPQNDNYLVDASEVKSHPPITMNDLGINATLANLPHAESQPDPTSTAVLALDSTAAAPSSASPVVEYVGLPPPPIEQHALEQQQHTQPHE